MRKMISAFVALLSIGVAFPSAHAQGMDEVIVVTGSRIEDGDAGMPYVTRAVRADFVVAELSCQSASRDQGERQRELRATYSAILTAAKSSPGFVVSGGELGYSSIPAETLKFEDVYARGTTLDSFQLILTADTRPEDMFETTFARMEDFVRSLTKLGRVECFLGSEQMIGIRHAQERREALLDDIAAEVAKIQSRFRASEVTISGLEAAVKTLASGPLQVTIYLPYTLSVKLGQSGKG